MAYSNQSYGSSGSYDYYSSSGGDFDLKKSIIFLTHEIVRASLRARHTNKYEDIVAWGAEIQAFSSLAKLVIPFDQDYIDKKKEALDQSKLLFDTVRNTNRGRFELFDLYDDWFEFICMKIQENMNIAPQKSVEYGGSEF